MGAAAIPLLAGSTALQIYSSIQAGEAQNKIAKYNAAVSEQEGIAAEKRAEFNEALHRERVKRALSSQRAARGASGVELPTLGLEESAAAGELDALVIRHGGEIEKGRAESSAEIEREKGRQARIAGRIGAGTSLLSGGAKIAGAK